MNCTSSRPHTPPSVTIILALAAAFLLAGTCFAQGTFVSFDGPHAGTAMNHGTFPAAMNRLGGVALTTIDDSGTVRAYVRHPNGTYLQILPPGATYTYVAGINASGQVAGSYGDSQNHQHGYIRNTDGTYVTLDPPGSTGTTLVGINAKGQVVGNANALPFFWDPSQPNTYVAFNPGGTSPFAVAINDNGQIAGNFGGSHFTEYGFLRQSDGTISSFTLPSDLAFSGLHIYGMNKWGTILGGFFDENGSDSAMLLRYSGGGQKYVFGSSHGGLNPVALSDNGVAVGTDFGGDTNYGNAFSVDRTLKETLIPVPFPAQGSTANAINSAGQIAGTYIDNNGASHGWIYLP